MLIEDVLFSYIDGEIYIMENQIAYFYTMVINLYLGDLFSEDVKTGNAIFSVKESPTKIYHTNIFVFILSHVILWN